MPYEGFVFSEETSALSEAEFACALAQLDAVEASMGERAALFAADADAETLYAPDAGWHPHSQPSFEIDGSTKNAQTSYGLLAGRDFHIIRKLRLYAQAFTGYQLATLEFADKRPWIARRLPDNVDEMLRLLAGKPDPAVLDYVSVARALPERLRARPPEKFGEIGWRIDGAIVNDDTHAYLERLCLMHENGLMDHLAARLDEKGMLTVIEIGGGYGGLACQLMGVFENRIRYAIIDIPESLAFSAVYLSVLFPDLANGFAAGKGRFALDEKPGFTFIPNYLHEMIEASDEGVDLLINTLSLSEMSDAQIVDYACAGGRLIGRRGLFFEQNHQTDHTGPGGLFPAHFKNLRKCTTRLLGPSFPARRGDANIWVNAGYEG